MTTDLVSILDSAAERWPERVAWTFDPGERLTFGEVGTRTLRYANALRERGVRPGDRVAVMLRNTAEFPLTWLALARLGAVMVPLNVKYRSADAEHVLRESEAAAIVTTPEFDELLAGIGPRVLHVADLESGLPETLDHKARPTDTVNIQFTSGTTGRPKGCVLSHRYWTVLGGSMVEEFPRLTGSDVLLTAQPFHYIDPQWNVVAGLLAGAELVVLDGFHPASFWAKVREHRVTYFYCLGAMPTLLLRMPPDELDRAHLVRAVQCSAIPPKLHAELEQRWGVGWYEAFGMTETGGDLRVTELDHDELVGTGCLGGPTRNREVRIVDGEILLRGPGMMNGYLNHEPVFREGWFHTGDLGRMDERGRVYHTGRLKDMIRRSGENIAAREVEEVLLTHPEVRLAAVVGVADELRGEEVKAHLVSEADPSELAEFCLQRLASFKVPRYWQRHEDLPRTASQRVAKAELAALHGPVFDRTTGQWSAT
ncbi:ATP-dependent acyl-CoA ligase [Kutzneria viridogrisea]|uniref:Crotonobetaine/carnitine-CoA ligase n=1 Tax=Kutzneria viridogrisea TaxID=47990 RepID=A0ABR6BNF8_9PSEU|nr:crotonobetaine/carnitine-CoA ligase [Kutzneria viridogrisea]